MKRSTIRLVSLAATLFAGVSLPVKASVYAPPLQKPGFDAPAEGKSAGGPPPATVTPDPSTTDAPPSTTDAPPPSTPGDAPLPANPPTASSPAGATASTPPPSQPPQPSSTVAPEGQTLPGWDDPVGPPTAATPQPSPAATPQPAPAAATPPPQASSGAPPPEPNGLRPGDALLIGAGVSAAVGLLANGLRIYAVNVPCQTPTQDYCTGTWAFASTVAWVTNPTSIVMFAIGGAERGRYDARRDPERHKGRRVGLTTAGSILMSLGVVGNILIRSAWLIDYTEPEGPEFFDFARAGHAIAYYGGLQGTSMMVAGGLAMLTYGSARPPLNKPRVTLAPMGYGLQIAGRF